MTASFQAGWLAALDHHALVLVTGSAHQIFRRRLDAVRGRVRSVLVLDETGAARSRSLEWLEAQRGEPERPRTREVLAELDDDFVDG